MGEPEVIDRSIPAESTAQLSSAYKFDKYPRLGKSKDVETAIARSMKQQRPRTHRRA